MKFFLMLKEKVFNFRERFRGLNYYVENCYHYNIASCRISLRQERPSIARISEGKKKANFRQAFQI